MNIASDLNKRINSLPKKALIELEQFLNYLDYKHNQTDDWADELSDEEIKSIQRGKKDIENGRTIPHAEASEIMSEHWKK